MNETAAERDERDKRKNRLRDRWKLETADEPDIRCVCGESEW